jgi:extracellular factor (EF) 3-hydroxypalmitic acid methyl ester biosynthesis protein
VLVKSAETCSEMRPMTHARDTRSDHQLHGEPRLAPDQLDLAASPSRNAGQPNRDDRGLKSGALSLDIKATRDEIFQALSRCDKTLTPSSARIALKRLVRDLAAIRSSSDPKTWRTAARESRVHPIHGRLREDPYTNDAFRKPRGFAGDAATLDFVYRHRPVPITTTLGRSLFAVSTEVPLTEAVRDRCRHIASLIKQTLDSTPMPTIVSIASGHMRELHLIPGEQFAAARLLGLDQDEQATRDLPGLHPGVPVLPTNAAIKRLLSGTCQIPEANLIYASGLYDYLDDRTALLLTQVLCRRLCPGGVLLLANLSPANEEIAFMEVVMDWWMIYRTAEQMTGLAVGSASETGDRVEEVYSLSHGRVVYARIRSGRHYNGRAAMSGDC